MKTILEIRSSFKSYPIEISQGGVYKFLMTVDSKYKIVDKKVFNLWASLEIDSPILVDATEENKTLLKVSSLIESLRDIGASRNSNLIAVGGGIVQDLSTFIASSYMRGIKWYYAPTTLLGMVDSCIGGKSSINVGKFKNIAGNFFPPESIHIDVNFCKTLTDQQLVEGLFEAAKICYAHSDKKFIEYLSLINLKKPLHDLDFEKIVALSLKTKKHFIEEDEFDNGIRLLLNFGHTFGHAIESAGNYSIPHGVAVGLGMVSAYKLSLILGLVDIDNEKSNKLISHVFKMLGYVENLNSTLALIDMEIALQKFMSDKKHNDTYFVTILYNKDGYLIREKIKRSEDNIKLILEAFYYLKTI